MSKIRKYLDLVSSLDESLQEHDDKYHDGHYEEGQKCGKRDGQKEDDKSDGLEQADKDIIACGPYYGSGLREIAHGIKNGNISDIRRGAMLMSDKIPDNAILVPMPGHTGTPTNELTLAEEIAKIKKGCSVANILSSNPHESSYANKKRGDTRGPQISMRKAEGFRDNGRPVIVIDNVIASGATWGAAKKVLPNSRLAVLADSGIRKGSKYSGQDANGTRESNRLTQPEKSDTIGKLKSIAKEIYNGKAIHQRIPAKALRGVQEGGVLLAEGALAARLWEGASDETASRLGDKGRAVKQWKAIKAVVSRDGKWAENIDKELEDKFGEPFCGGETMVWFDDAKKECVKLISDAYYNEPVLVMDRIALHNWLFPDTAIRVVGFGTAKGAEEEFGGSDKVIKAVQPMVKISRGATVSETNRHMAGLGFRPTGKRVYEYINEDRSIIIGDLHDENAVIDADGNFRVIDADIRLNTPNLGERGGYVINPLYK